MLHLRGEQQFYLVRHDVTYVGLNDAVFWNVFTPVTLVNDF
jgi:hypothetical protein